MLAAPLPQADAPAAGFLLPDDEHVGDLLELRIADFRPQLLVAAIHFDPQAGLPELGRGVVRVIQKLFRKGQHDGLHRRQPDRKRAGEVLDDDGDEALQRSEDGPMDHDRPMLGVVRADVGQLEPLRLRVIDLHGAELPRATDGIGHLVIQFRPVERTLAGIDLI